MNDKSKLANAVVSLQDFLHVLEANRLVEKLRVHFILLFSFSSGR